MKLRHLLPLVVCVLPLAAAEADPSLLTHLTFQDRSSKPVDHSGHGTKTRLFGKAGFASAPEGRTAIVLLEGGSLELSKPADFVRDTQAVTVAFWVLASDYRYSTRLVQKGNQDDEWRIHVNQKGEFVWGVHGKTSGAVYVRPPQASRWVHVAATYADNTLRLFFDGTQVADRKTGPEKMRFSRHPVTVAGGWNDRGQIVESFEGRFADFRYYNRALSPQEIAALAQRSR